MKKPFVYEDIADISCLNQVHLNPSGTYAFFNRITPDRKKNVNTTRLFVLDREKETVRQMTYTAENGCTIWDDDETLLLQTERKDEDKPEKLEEKTVFYRMSIHGGEAYPAFTIKRNVDKIEKVRDGLYVVQITDDLNRIDPEKDKEAAEEECDYHVLEEVPFWANGAGYIAGLHNGLYLFEEKTGDLKRITPENTDTDFFSVKEGKVLYTSSVLTGVPSLYSILSLYDLETEETKVIVEDQKLMIRHAVFREEDILFLAHDMIPWGTGQLSDWYHADPVNGTYELLKKNTEEYAFCDIPTSDTVRPGGFIMKTIGDAVYFLALKTYHTDLYRFNADQTIELVQSSNEGAFSCFDGDEKGIVSVYIPKDRLSVLNINEKTVFDPNEALLADREVSETEHQIVINRAGIEIEGWVIKPYDYDPEKTYPAVLEIHGGPRGAYGTMMNHEMQSFAGKGMFVIFCNPRGSEGYGEEFADLRGKYGTIDFEDLMDYLDGILERYPNIDPKRVAASGGSYGGFMCNWIVGHTDRFACIASQRSISNWLSDFGTSEIGQTFDKNEMGTDPWTDPEAIWNASPVKYACYAKTPILFIHSLMDYNCMVEQGAQMFAAMKYFGVPSRMVVFEGESHGLSRVGKPKHRIRRLREIGGWFDKYCF